MKQNNFPEEITFPPTKPPELASSARIKAGSRADIRAAQDELDAWIVQQRNDTVAAAAQVVWHDLRAAQIGTWPSPAIKTLLVEDVANLERARADSRSARKPENVNDINDAVPHGLVT